MKTSSTFVLASAMVLGLASAASAHTSVSEARVHATVAASTEAPLYSGRSVAVHHIDSSLGGPVGGPNQGG